MRSSGVSLVTGLLTSLAVGCASTSEHVEIASASEVASVPPPAPSAPSPSPESDAPPAHPRLSHTITLGHPDDEVTYSGDRPGPARDPGPQVVVNNQIIMQGGVPSYGYGSYGYGYGSYGYGGGRGFARGDGLAPRSNTTFQWSQSGFEGARRTAAPGQTPAIGGNWSPPPSYGPRSMR